MFCCVGFDVCDEFVGFVDCFVVFDFVCGVWLVLDDFVQDCQCFVVVVGQLLEGVGQKGWVEWFVGCG